MTATRRWLGAAARTWMAALCVLTLAGLPAAAMAAGDDAVAEVVGLVDAGRFQAARDQIARRLAAESVAPELRRELEFQRERMRRILLEFTLTEEEARAQVRKHIPDLRDAEFAAWDAAGHLEHQVIDGRKLYFQRAPSNLFRESAEARARRATPLGWKFSPLEQAHPHHREVIDAAVAGGGSSIAARRVRVTQSLTVDADVVPAGETIRAWIPIPRALRGQQEEIRWLESVPAQRTIAADSVLQRTVYLEAASSAGVPTQFSITYELTIFGRYQPIDPDRVVRAPLTPDLARDAGERPPHIVFTDALRDYSRRVVGEETNPYRIAQKLFAAVDSIPWGGAREYSTLSNISDHALRAGHADCGQQTLLLMTLLRLNGIPARWQSGWIFSDGEYDNMHDWGWLYLAPYGWIPMDVTFGRLASNDAAVAQFYLGGLDAYRIACNDDYAQPLSPPKEHFRSETVDSQRGEVEWRGGNLYFDQWDYTFKARVLPHAVGAR